MHSSDPESDIRFVEGWLIKRKDHRPASKPFNTNNAFIGQPAAFENAESKKDGTLLMTSIWRRRGEKDKQWENTIFTRKKKEKEVAGAFSSLDKHSREWKEAGFLIREMQKSLGK